MDPWKILVKDNHLEAALTHAQAGGVDSGADGTSIGKEARVSWGTRWQSGRWGGCPGVLTRLSMSGEDTGAVTRRRVREGCRRGGRRHSRRIWQGDAQTARM